MHRRIVAVMGAMFITLMAIVALAAPASAEGQALGGRLENRVEGVKTPVPEVEITVVGSGFEETVTSDEDGVWRVELPALGNYDVSINVDTLPEGVGLTEEDKVTLEQVAVQPPLFGGLKTVIFPLGQSVTIQSSIWEQTAQLTISGIQFGLLIALGALGLSIIYGTTGLVNFAHGEIITFGALATWTLNAGFGLPFILAAIGGLLLSAAFGWLNNAALWRPLRRRGTGLIAMMIVSIGLALFLRNFYQFFVGAEKKSYADYAGLAGIRLGPISVTPTDIAIIITAIVALTITVLVLSKTRLGKATRAVSDNPSLAAGAGINVERVITFVWVIGAALAGLGGTLLGFTQQVSFQMGFQILLLVFAAVTLGGLGTISGAIFGSLVVGLFIQLTTLIIPTELKNVGALLVLIVILLVRPYGLLGRRERVG